MLYKLTDILDASMNHLQFQIAIFVYRISVFPSPAETTAGPTCADA